MSSCFSIRNPLIPEQMRLAAQRGARAAVIYDSGFAELGDDGARLQEEIAGALPRSRHARCAARTAWASSIRRRA